MTLMQLLFNSSSTRRILGLAPTTQVKIQVWDKVIWVWVKGQRPTLISKKKYFAEFARFRKEGGEKVKVYFANGYKAEGAKETYSLDPQEAFIDCSCVDMQQQKEIWGKGCCKHGYALLGMLGYSTLQEYVAKH
jgi:hypothetical protein